MCVVIINSYTGNLTSYLTIPALKPIPNSFEELAASKDISLIVDHKSVLAEQILARISLRIALVKLIYIEISFT